MYANLHGAKVFTTLDLRSGYYHIALDKESKAKTAFVTPFGKYEFNAVPFGLAQAPAYFQQLISIVIFENSQGVNCIKNRSKKPWFSSKFDYFVSLSHVLM